MRGSRIFSKYKGDLKSKLFGKGKYGEYWQDMDFDFWQKMYDRNYLLHEDFKKFFNKRSPQIKTVLEAGCGIGVYPIQNKKMFSEIDYTGIDISESCIDYCKKNSQFSFFAGDFLKMNFDKSFDLVYSHDVITHVPDIDGFFRKCLKLTDKFLYVCSDRGFHPNLENHKQIWSESDSCYYNDLSVKQLERILAESSIEKDQYVIRSQESGSDVKGSETKVLIEVNRNKEEETSKELNV
jgi:ubiquinone/menaquinone biosynthesis C-methylase UbiE